MLELKNLVKSYKKKEIVRDVSIDIKRGEITGLLGPNGAGKTTTFYMAVGMIYPNSGKIYLDKKEITNYPMFKRAQSGISYLPQEASIFRKLTVEENILIVLETIFNDKKKIKEECLRLLQELKIERLINSKAQVLSGGERRRLEIARTLALKPSFILLDEPFAGIDPIAVMDIQKIIKELAAKNIGILISDHNVRETLQVCNVAYILSQGKIIEKGSPEEIANSEKSRQIYLGENFKL